MDPTLVSIMVLLAATLLVFGVFLLLFIRHPARMINGFVFDIFLGMAIGTLTLAMGMSGNAFLQVIATLFIILAGLILLYGIFILILFLFVNAVQVFRKESHSLSNMLTLFVAVGMCVQIILTIYSVDLMRKSWMFILFGLLYIIEFYLAVTVISFITSSMLIRLAKPKRNVDYIIVLGCGLKDGLTVTPLLASRVDKGIRFYQNLLAKGKHPRLLFSGGQAGAEKRPEAEAMFEYAQSKGIPTEDMRKEDKSVNTLQNMQFSKKIMDEESPQGYRCALSTSNYHVFRACVYAEKAGLKKVRGLSAKTARYFVPNATLREYIAMLVINKKSNLILIGIITVCYLLLMGIAMFVSRA